MVRKLPIFIPLLLALGAGACTDSPSAPETGGLAPEFGVRRNGSAAAPAQSRTARFGERSLTLWPYLGTPDGTASDPVNLLFIGRGADPRALRAALMALDGNRLAFGFPAGAPFDCRWSDTPSGDVQASWTEEGGWLAGAIQLACGDYGPIRFHVRLFRSGQWTVGGAHFEVLIPGTAEHQVLSWELAEQLVTVDLMRTGLLDAAVPLAPSEVLGAAPSFRTIPAIIFNGLPAALQALAAGAPGSVSADVPIATDGRATIFDVAREKEYGRDAVRRSFTITYGQVIPKPFCNSPGDYVYVQGPITLTEFAALGQGGRYTSEFRASGRLDVTPVNPLTGQPSGPTYTADIAERHSSFIGNDGQGAASDKRQALLPPGTSGHGWLHAIIDVDSRGMARNRTDVHCTP